MDDTEKGLLIHPSDFHFVIKKCRDFFLSQGFIESHTQNRLSILAACEDPSTLTCFELNHKTYPLPQTGQMWLEYDLLTYPDIYGVFCVSTSYRDEPHPISGRHKLIFPMFEFEFKGDMQALEKLECALLKYLGYQSFEFGNYLDIAQEYHVGDIDHAIEQKIYQDKGAVFFLENFPEYTHPFWNMKRNHQDKTVNKIDVILSGMETIGSAERSTDKREMLDYFNHIVDGTYAQNLYQKFGRNQVEVELAQFLNHDFFVRCGGGIGLTRLIDSMRKENLIPKERDPHG